MGIGPQHCHLWELDPYTELIPCDLIPNLLTIRPPGIVEFAYKVYCKITNLDCINISFYLELMFQ